MGSIRRGDVEPAVDSRTGDPTVRVRNESGEMVMPDENADLQGGDVFGHGFGFGKNGLPPRGGPTV